MPPRSLHLMSVLCLLFVSVACDGHQAESDHRELTVSADGVSLHATYFGDPDAEEALIVLHGGPGMCSHYLASLAELAGEHLQVVTFDERGCCRSSTPVNGYALERYWNDLDAVRATITADSIHLLGHSWGGLVAMTYAASRPGEVTSIILMGSGPPSYDAMMAGAAHKALRLAELQAQNVIPAQISSLADILPVYFSDPGFTPPPELRNMHYYPAVEQQTMAALGEFDYRAEVATLTHRILFLWGEDDPFGLPMADATLTALSSATVEYVLLEGCGHFWHETPEPFYTSVRGFLAIPSTVHGVALLAP